MIHVPSGDKELLKLSLDLIEQCRVSQGKRAAYCRLMNTIAETGRYDGSKALINTMQPHLRRTQAHLFSPVELKFSCDFEDPHADHVYAQGRETAKVVTRQWNRTSTDILFERGVYEALKYGAAITKQWAQMEGPHAKSRPSYYMHLVMPWQFGVYNEAENNINRQAALCETSTITLPEVWRRISHLPDARKLYSRISTHASRGNAISDPQSFFHQVLSTSQLNTGLAGSTRPLPGGIVQLGVDPNYGIMGPEIGAETVTYHELWVQDDDDYTTIQIVEPDVIIAPRVKKSNLLIKDSGLQPYRLIQPNEMTNYFWGRPELVDLIETQALLAQWCDDTKRMWGLQVDKIMGFSGENGLTDEKYDQFRQAGWTNLGNGGDIKDVTPKFPPEALPMLKFLIETINTLGGFPPIMQGTGEPGVRAGVHANTLLKTGSPTLRDRALLIERQCANSADLTNEIMAAKEERFYWTDGSSPEKQEETKFLLSQLPDDARITVDSHSSSPIFADENTQLVATAHKMGIVDGDYVIDNTPLPNKEQAKVSLKKKQEAQAKMTQDLIKQFPEAGEKIALKQVMGGKR